MEDPDDVVRPLRPRPPNGRAGRGGRAGSRGGVGGAGRGRTGRRLRPGWIISLLVIAALVVTSLLRLWVDLLWFAEVDQREVLVTRLEWSTAMGVVSGAIVALVLHANFLVARRVARRDLYVPFLAPRADPDSPEQPTVPEFVMRPILLAAALIGGVIAGLVMASHWETILSFTGRSDFGVKDPHFGRDASFYVFTMPLLELILRFVQTLVILSLMASALAYTAMGVIRYVPAWRIARPAITHLALLVAAFLVTAALQYRLSIWDLVLSTSGAATGVGWTDSHARIPAYYVMIVASLVLAGVIAWYARRERWPVVGGAVVAWVALSVLATGVIPSVVQSVLVKPNELDREQSVLKGNIDLTRRGYRLGDVDQRPFTDRTNLTPAQLSENSSTTENLRLWSPEVLERSFNAFDSIRPYYRFEDVDVDRYEIDGETRQVMLAVRELDPTAIDNPTWTNQRLVFTHGYGAVVASSTAVDGEGKPRRLLRNIPPVATGGGEDTLELRTPGVYFGEGNDEPVIVRSREEEFDFPEGDDNRFGQYEGEGGIRVSGVARRAALAVSMSDPRILVTGQISGESRVLLHREVRGRIQELAPFLTLDSDPYPVVHDGRIVWMQDAFTTSDRFPYAAREALSGSVNYVRNSVKATVDAYDGTVKLYVADDRDPILKAWRKIFPTLFTPIEEMPDDLRLHVRYPEDLFRLQTERWLTYHMGNERTFYNREDVWAVPQLNGSDQEAYYLLARLPGEQEAEMLLVRPLVPRGRKNLIAYMAVRMDGDNYGDIITLQLPKQSITQGPQQVQSLIKQEPEIAEQVRLWRSGDAEPEFGNLLVLPVEESLLYVQPVYLENDEANIPAFQRVVVVLGDDIAWAPTFEEAVVKLYEERAGLDTGDESPEGTVEDSGTGDDVGGADTGSDSGGSSGDGDDSGTPGAGAGSTFDSLAEPELRSTLAEISRRYDAAEQCQRQGDFECYAREIEAIERLLEEASQPGGGEDVVTTSQRG